MGEYFFHWMIILAFFGVVLGIPWFAYRHGKKVGDQEGYIRGFKEGQQSVTKYKIARPLRRAAGLIVFNVRAPTHDKLFRR